MKDLLFPCLSDTVRIVLLFVTSRRVTFPELSTKITWAVFTAWASVESSVAFRHWLPLLQVPKYYLVTEFKVETLYSGTGIVSEI